MVIVLLVPISNTKNISTWLPSNSSHPAVLKPMYCGLLETFALAVVTSVVTLAQMTPPIVNLENSIPLQFLYLFLIQFTKNPSPTHVQAESLWLVARTLGMHIPAHLLIYINSFPLPLIRMVPALAFLMLQHRS